MVVKNVEDRFNLPIPNDTTHVHIFDKDAGNIKSATGNNGRFDRDNPNIFKQGPVWQRDVDANFDKWKGTDAKPITPDKGYSHDYTKPGPHIAEAYNGGTREFDEFDAMQFGWIAGAFGKVNYFSGAEWNSENYQGGDKNMDLQARMERASMRISNQVQDELEGRTPGDDILDVYMAELQDATTNEPMLAYYDFSSQGYPSDVYEEAEAILNGDDDHHGETGAEAARDYIVSAITDVADEIARELDGGEPTVRKFYLRLNNPIVIGGPDGARQMHTVFPHDVDTMLERAAAHLTEKTGELVVVEQLRANLTNSQLARDEAYDMDGEVHMFLEAVMETAESPLWEAMKRTMADPEVYGRVEMEYMASDVELFAHLWRQVALEDSSMYSYESLTGLHIDDMEGVENGAVNSERLYKVLGNVFSQAQSAETPEDRANTHLMAQTMKNMGYDSIVLKDVDRIFWGQPTREEKIHYHMFDDNKTNIKSAQFNSGMFDPDNPNVYKQGPAQPKRVVPKGKGFEKFTDGKGIIEPEDAREHNYLEDGPHNPRVWSGSTHMFDTFDAEGKAWISGFLGKVNYFSGAQWNSENYQGGEKNKDLEHRIRARARHLRDVLSGRDQDYEGKPENIDELRFQTQHLFGALPEVEQNHPGDRNTFDEWYRFFDYEAERQGLDEDEYMDQALNDIVQWIAERELTGGEPNVREYVLRMDNPYVINGEGDTAMLELPTGEILLNQIMGAHSELFDIGKIYNDEEMADFNALDEDEQADAFEAAKDQDFDDALNGAREDVADMVFEELKTWHPDFYKAFNAAIEEAERVEATHESFMNMKGIIAHALLDNGATGDMSMTDFSNLLHDMFHREGQLRLKDNEGQSMGGHLVGKVIQALGYDAIIIKDVDALFWGTTPREEKIHYHIFHEDRSNIKAIDNEGGFDRDDPNVYKQDKGGTGAGQDTDAEGEPWRGEIDIPPGVKGEAVIRLFKDADLSTFLHESGHFFLTMLMDMARSEDASPEIRQLVADTQLWWKQNAKDVARDATRWRKAGGDEGETTAEDVIAFLEQGSTGDRAKDRSIHVGAQEQWVRAFETYLMDGKAPSSSMRTVFGQFRSWLLEVYRHVQGDLEVNVSPEIRNVFDRLLASDAELAAAREDGHDAMLAESAEAMGLTEAEYRALADLHRDARDAETAKATKRAMAPIKRMKSRSFRALLNDVSEEAEKEVNAKPVYRAIEWMGNKRWIGEDGAPEALEGMRLNRRQLVERYGEAVLRKLPRGSYTVYTPGGMDMDQAAGWFGFRSGDEMLQEMLKAPKRADAVKNEKRRRAEIAMERQEAEADAAEDAAEREADRMGDFIAAELRTLRKQMGQGAGSSTAGHMRQQAKIAVNRMATRDAIASNRYLAAERRAAEEAQKAFAKGDREMAADWKRKQLFNHMLHIESRRVANEVGKLERLARRLSSKATRKNLDPRYIAAINEVLDNYDFTDRGPGREASRGRLMDYIARMRDEGRENEVAVPQHVLDNAEIVPYKTLSVERLRGVYATLRNLETSARRGKKLIDKKRTRTLDTVAAGIVQQFQKHLKPKKPSRVENNRERRGKRIRNMFTTMLTAETILREVDGFGSVPGFVYNNVKRGIDEATSRLQVRRKDAAKSLDKIWSVYSKKDLRAMNNKLHRPELGGSYSKMDLIAIVLNMGNEDNIQRLTDERVDGHFTMEQLDVVVGLMDKRDLDTVQAVWDYINGFWGEIAERETRLTGEPPQKVEPSPLETAHGTYRGGYYPLRYDARLSALAFDDSIDDIVGDMMAGRYAKAYTRNGHLQSRMQSSGRPVLLDIGVLYNHVNQVLHDLELSEEVANTWRVLNHGQVRSAFINHGRQGAHESLRLWIKDVASGEIKTGEEVSRTFRYLRSGFTIAVLGFNFATAAIQITGLAQSFVVVGHRAMAKGVYEYAKNPMAAARMVQESSPFMQERMSTFNKDIFDTMGDMKLGPGVGGRLHGAKQEWLAPAMFWLMGKVQFYAVDMPTWIGAYKKAMKETNGDVDASIHAADRGVSRSQASGVFGDRSSVERGTLHANQRQSDVVRMFTTLGSFVFATTNAAYEQVAQMNLKDPRTILKATLNLAILYTLQGVLYSAIKGDLPDPEDDEDTWLKFLARSSIFGAVGGLLGLRDIASVAAGYGGGGGYGAITEEIADPFLAFGDVFDEGFEAIDHDFVKSLIGASGILLHLPSVQATRIYDAATRQLDNEDVSPIEYAMGRRKE